MSSQTRTSSLPVLPDAAMPPWQRRTAAICEVIFVLVLGTILTSLVIRALGIAMPNVVTLRYSDMSDTDLIALAGKFAVYLLVQYGLYAALFLSIGAWHRRRPLRAYGLQRGGRPWPELVLTGAVLWAVMHLPLQILVTIHNQVISLGHGPPHWRELFSMAWGPGFWFFMAVGSFVLIPLVEELFFRGYVQTRWREDFGAGAAVILAAAFFGLLHNQYQQADMLSIGTIVCTLWGAMALGWTYHRTGSLIPVTLAHALVNVPNRGIASWLLIVAMIALLAFFRRSISVAFGELCVAVRAVEHRRTFGLAVALLGLFLVTTRVWATSNLYMAWGVGCGIVALALEYRGRRIARPHRVSIAAGDGSSAPAAHDH